MQELDFEWFVENMQELYKKYGRVFLAIKNKTILGSYKTYAEGVNETAKKEPLGSFIVQECGPDESAYTVYIASANFA